ncbi:MULTISPECIES: YidB family protein [unclassified Variovorax]|uniref:YidB family protein n=1 Tax=unclassified Variovorax TaxID=663243 RepID=UPI001BD55F23|nr:MULTISPECIES: YidB family protein [unclassified Variovorax]
MGMLSEIVGGFVHSALGTRGAARPGGGVRGPLLMALLPILLSMLSRQGAQDGGAYNGATASAGGLGGLGDLLGRLTQKGYGRQAASWVGDSDNEPLPPGAIDEIFDANELQHVADQAGISSDEARAGISELLPDVVDHLTPQGIVPEDTALTDSVDTYLRRLA